jgi:hypothetical protein
MPNPILPIRRGECRAGKQRDELPRAASDRVDNGKILDADNRFPNVSFGRPHQNRLLGLGLANSDKYTVVGSDIPE